MKATRYFLEQVLRKRPYAALDLCLRVIADPVRKAIQADGRIRYWGRFSLPGQADARILRVVTLADGETVHNAFIDRNFREDEQ